MKRTCTNLGIFFFSSLFIFSSLVSISQSSNDLNRKEFSNYLLSHPFMKRKRMTPEEIKKLPKKDRPDLAWEQDFLSTLDPQTGKPERTRLLPTLQIVDQFKSALTPAVPGSSTSAAWVERGPNNVGGRTRALLWDPNDPNVKKVWAGGVTGGLWYNNDITNPLSQWVAVNDFWDNISITSIAYDPNNTNTFYVGTGEGFGAGAARGAGIWKSTDGGNTWSQISSTSGFYYVNDLVVRDENGTSVIYAAVDGNFYNGSWHGAAQSGLQRSLNGGSTWTQVLPSVPSGVSNYVASDIEIGPDNRIWIGTRRNPYGDNGAGGKVLYSDNGTTWTVSSTTTVAASRGRVEVAVAPSDSATVYAIIENNGQVEAIKKTTNHGATWTSLSEPADDDLGIPASDFSRGQAWYDLIAAVDPNDPNKVIVGAINAHMSTNGGTSWNQISKWSNNPNMGTQPYSYIHADHHNILFKPGSSSEVIFGTDGGVSWTNNLGSAATSAVFSDRNNGYNVTQFYAGGMHPTAGNNVMVGGTQDNGSHRYSTAGINSTTEISGGDGAYCFIDQTNGIDVITSYVYNNYYHFNNSGLNYVKKFMSNSNTGLFINPADLDDMNNIMYSTARTGQLYKVSNYNSSSYSVDSFNVTGLTNYASALKVSPYNNSNNLYVGDLSGNLIKVNNANGSSPTFSNLTDANFPNGTISSIEFGSSENEILVTFKNYGVASVFYSTNGGSTWDNKEGNLPDMPVRWILMNPSDNNEVIIATEIGIWSTTNFQASAPSWSPSNSGLANVRVDMLQYRSSDHTVMAITHGRGIFTSNAWGSSSSTPQLPFRTIAEMKNVDQNGEPDSLNVACKIQGVVTSIDFDGNAGYNFFVQDTTGGIYVYSPVDLNNYQANIGDEIRLIGDIQQYNGLTEFVPDSLALVSTGNNVPFPQSVFNLTESNEGNLIALNFCYLVNPSAWPTTSGNHNVPIITGGGDTVIMRLDVDANLIPGMPAPVGPFTVIGCQSQFDSSFPYLDGRQVFPRYITDVYSAAKVRFSVDMSNQTVSPNGVHIAGNFGNGNPNLPSWNPGGIQLFDSSGTGVYEVLLTLSLGYYEYKFINDDTWANGNDEVISGCNAPGTSNRFVHLNGDTTMPAFCFESCVECPQGGVLYSFDFANGIPSGWTNVGDTTTSLWEYRGTNTTPNVSTGSRGAFNGLRGPIQSTTSSNGFVIFDSDYLDDPLGFGGPSGSSPSPHIGGLITNSLNFSNEQNVIIQFESYYRTFESAVGVSISIDGGLTYVDTHYVHTNLATNDETATTDLVRIDISNVAGGESNVKIAFVFDGTNPLGLNGGQLQRSYYFWMIDDIQFLQTPPHDLNLTDAYYTLGNFLGRYGKLPANVSPPITFWGNITNEGTATQTNARVTFNSSNFNYSSSSNLIQPDSSLLLSSTTTFYPSQSGNYTFTATASADSADRFNQNNSLQLGFEVSDSTINLATGISNDFFGTNSWANASDTFIVANILELEDSVEVNSVEVALSAASTPGGQIWIRFWDYNSTIRGAGGSFQNPETPESAIYTLTTLDIANGTVQIPIQGTGNSKKLLPGTYYVGAVLFGNNNADTVRVGSDNSVLQPFDAAVIYIPYSSGFGGVYTNGNAFNLDVNISPISPPTTPPAPMVNGDTLYTYDFNNGVPNGWSNSGSSANALWEYRGPNTAPNNTVGSRGAFNGTRGPINSFTASNGFMIFDSDYLDNFGGSQAPHTGSFITEALNFSQHQEIILQFNSYFRNYASGAGLAFSYDGGSTFPDTVFLHTELLPNFATTDNEVVRFDASPYIGGKPNVKVAFVFDGNNPLGFNTGNLFGYYFWMIDDVSFLVKPGNDLVARNVSISQPNTFGQHHVIPQFLAKPWELEGQVINKGRFDATGVSLYASTSTASNSFIPNFVSSTQGTLLKGDTSQTFNYAPFFFNNLETYNFAFYPTSDSTEDFTVGDTIYRSFTVTPKEYRLDRNVWSSAIGTNSFTANGSADSFIVANQFPIYTRTVIDTMIADIGSASRVGGQLIPVGYRIDANGSRVKVFEGTPYTLTSADTVNFNAIIPVNQVLDSGVYYIGFMLNSNGNSTNVTVIDDESHYQHPDAAQIRLGNIWYSNGNAFHIILKASQAPPGLPYRTLAELTTEDVNGVADSNNLVCATAGIVASPNFSANGAGGPDVTFAVINSSNTAGITAISFDPTTTLGYTPQIGDSVYMYGTVNQFNGLTQFDLDSIEVKSTGNVLPTESFLSGLGENEESRLIRLDNVALVTPSQWPTVGTDANVDIEYGGNTFTMRVDRHTDIAQNLSAPTGRFNVIGIGGQFDNNNPFTDGYRILPRSASDITQLYGVTFQVDMANETVDPAGPHIAGEFNDHNGDGYPENYTNAQWVSNANPMTQDINNPSVYSTTIWVQADSLEYKFLNGSQWGQDEQLTVGSSCTKTTGQFTNRIAGISSDTILALVCFETCASCVAPKAKPDLPITWEDTATVDYDFADFNGTFSTYAADPTNPNNVVLKTEKSPTGQPWQGTIIADGGLANPIPFGPGATTMTAVVYSPDLGIPVRLKVESDTNSNIFAEVEAFTTVSNAWDTLVFDFSSPAAGSINFANSYNKVVIFYDFLSNPASTKTYYVDSIDFGGVATPPCPSFSFAPNVTTVSCFGGGDGAISVVATGGNDPYSYDWGFAQGNTISALSSGIYRVTVTDSVGCIDSADILVRQPLNPINTTLLGNSPILKLNNSNGANFLMDFGGMAGVWGTTNFQSNTSGSLVVARDTSAADSLACFNSITNAAAITGNIAVVYRGACQFSQKALACQQAGAAGVIIINNNPDPNVNMDGGILGAQVTIPVMMVSQVNGVTLRNLINSSGTAYMGLDTANTQNPLCFGDQNGIVEALINGGTSPYTYQWNNNQPGREITGLVQGQYIVTITDAKGCTKVDTANLVQPNALAVGLDSALNPTSNTVFDGSLEVAVNGGTTPYGFLWNTVPAQTSNPAINLGSGNYTVSVTDANGCSDQFSYTLCVDDTASSQVIICSGDTAVIFGNNETTSGFYYQSFTSIFGCDSVIEVELVVNPTPVISNVAVGQLTGCGSNDGSLNITASGGTGTLTYALSSGVSQTGNGNFNGLFPANYSVTVSDVNGCSDESGLHVINPFTGSPTQPTVTSSSNTQYCFGDSILPFTATGGAGTLYWYDDAALTTPIDSGNSFMPASAIGFNTFYVAETFSGCQSPPAQVFIQINSVPSAPIMSGTGTYCDSDSINPIFAQGIGINWYSDSGLANQIGSGVQLNPNPYVQVGANTFYTNATSNGCISATSQLTLTVLASPAVPAASSASYCDNQSPISLMATLTGSNSARWYSDSSLNSLVSVNPSFTPSTQIGTSTFYLTQFDGTCESEAISVNSTVYAAPVINTVTTNDVTVCGATDGSLFINALVSNLSPKYSIDNGSSFQPTANFTGLAASGYVVVVADTFCSTTYGIATINAPGAPAAPLVFGADTLCDGDSIPTLGASAQGSGSLTWYNSPLLGASNQVTTGIVYTPTSLVVGANTFYVTETSGGCEGTASAVSIYVNAIPSVFAGADQSICIGDDATLIATGASTYNWVGYTTSDTLQVSPTSDTNFVVIGASAAGCSASDTIGVFVNPLPTVSAAGLPNLCDNQGNFLLPSGTPSGGLYSGNFVSNNTFLTSTAGAGSFGLSYSFTDNNGCTNSDSSTITVNAAPTVTVPDQANVCANASPVSLTGATPSGGTYSGNAVAANTFNPANSGPGTFSIYYVYTDLNGCTNRDTASISVDTVPQIAWIPFPTICELDNPYVLIEASPANGAYSGNGVSNGSFDPIAAGGAGAYTITYDFTDGNGCSNTSTQNLSVSANPQVDLGPDTTLCNNNPTITLDAGTGASFDWSIGGVSVGTNQTFNADSANSGNIIVVVTSSDGCEGSDTIVVDYDAICVGIEQVQVFTDFVNLYPNPSQGQITLEVGMETEQTVTMKLFSTNGQIVAERTYENQRLIKETLDLERLSTGVYYMQLRSDDSMEQYKVILQ